MEAVHLEEAELGLAGDRSGDGGGGQGGKRPVATRLLGARVVAELPFRGLAVRHGVLMAVVPHPCKRFA